MATDKSRMQKRIQVALALTLLAGGLLTAARPGYHIARRAWLQWHAATLWRDWRAAPRDFVPGRPAVWLESPAMALDTLVLFDATEENLARFPAISRSNGLPGLDDTLVIQGHRDGAFRKLGAARRGQAVNLTGTRGRWSYRVAAVEVIAATELARRLEHPPSSGGGAVLVTCFPLVYAGPAPNRLLVWLEPMEAEALAAGTGKTRAKTPSSLSKQPRRAFGTGDGVTRFGKWESSRAKTQRRQAC